ncbi:MAG: flagellar basal body P-ring formation chaperone FlgA [Planctomycetota bacterium JB042]
MIATALLLAALSAPPVPADAAPVVTLLERTSTPGTRIRLIDLVSPEHRGALAPTLLETDLGRAPSPGFERRVTRAAVRSMLPAEVRLDGAEESLVRSDIETVSGERLLAAARAHLTSDVRLDEGAELEVTRRPLDVRVPRGRDGVALVPRLRGNVRGRGAIQVLVDVTVDRKLQATVPVGFMARVFRDVPVLAHALSRGAHLTEADLTTARLELTRAANEPISDPSRLLGRVARRNLRAGDVLLDRDFEQPALVRRNEPVTLVFARGALRAETFGIARETGVLGDTVRIENLTTRKTVVGRVIGPGLVRTNP